MKKITFLLSSLLIFSGSNAQIFSDNFDALTVGDYIGPTSAYWSTWSGAIGGAEDAQVTNLQASSPNNSIYFSSTGANGGPQDVLLDFGQQYTDGVFVFESKFFVDAGKNAYFNFQGTAIAGGVYTINCYIDGGSIAIDNAASEVAFGAYADDTWFTLRIEANLSTGRWQASVDGACIGVWEMAGATIASADLYPILNSSFYMDDIMFDHNAYTAAALNATLSGFNIGGIIAGSSVFPVVNVTNSGSTEITSMDVVVDYNGTPYTENLTGLNFAAGTSMEVVFTSSALLVAGSSTATATVSNVNGGVDGDATDDDACQLVDPIVPAAGKMVVGEEGTGTWCGWCPRGTVAMDRFAADYDGYWAGIAVHNGDPMAVTEYDNGIGTLIGGYPSALVDRGPEVDPGNMSNSFFARLQTAPSAMMTNGATWNSTTRELVVSVSANFQTAGTNGYKMICVLTEDGVTGGSGYAQANCYAGGGNGVMGGFELLGNPVPAIDMVYDHVARAISNSFTGNNDCFPTSFASGEVVTQNFAWTLPAGWDENNMHIVGMLVSPSGQIDNADMTSITGAVTNGFVPTCAVSLGEIESSNIDDVLNVYPNPATTFAKIAITLKEESDVKLSLITLNGKIISSNDYGTIASSTVNLNTSALEAGVYLVELTVNGQKTTKRLIVE